MAFPRPSECARPVAVLLVASALMGVSACSRTDDYRYKVTVEIDDNGALRTGSAVTRVKAHEPIKALHSMSSGGLKRDREGVVVPMGGGRFLFAVGKGPEISLCGHADYWGCQRRLGESPATEPIEIPESRLPTFVVFGDSSSPSTARVVSPDELATTFGNGVRLRRVTVAITNERATRTIQEYLPWACGPLNTLSIDLGGPPGLMHTELTGSDFCERMN